jgi:hypothetical protein
MGEKSNEPVGGLGLQPTAPINDNAGFLMPNQARSGVSNQQDSWLNKSKVSSEDNSNFNSRINAGGLGKATGLGRPGVGGLGPGREERRSSGSPAEEISDNYDEDDFEVGESMANMDRGPAFLDDHLGGGLDGFNNKSNNMAKASDKESAGDVYAFDDQDDGDFFN